MQLEHYAQHIHTPRGGEERQPPVDATLTPRGPWATGYVARDPWITGERAATLKRGMDKRSQALPPRTACSRALSPAVGRSRQKTATSSGKVAGPVRTRATTRPED